MKKKYIKKILLTGENGFLGKKIKKKLLKKKNFLLIKKKSGSKYCIDLKDPKKVKTFLKKTQPDIIINAAVRANFNKEKKFKNMNKINCESVKVMANYCKTKSKKLIQVSGSIVHPKSRKYNLNTKLEPKNYYGRTKLNADKFIINKKINYTIIRFGGIFGKMGPSHLFINKILKSKAKNIKYTGNFHVKRNYIHVEDAANNIIKIIQKNLKGIFYSGGEIISFRKMLNLIAKKKKISIDLIYRNNGDFDEIVENNKLFKFKKFSNCL